MKDIELLWQYQELDMQVDKLEQELKASEDRKKAIHYRNIYNAARDEMKAIEDGTDALSKEMERIEKGVNDLSGQFDVTVETEEDVQAAQKTYSEISGKINQLTRTLKALLQKAQEMEKKMQEQAKKAAAAKTAYNEHKKGFEERSAEFAPKIDEARGKRDEFGKQVKPALLEKYNKLKSSRRRPISLLKGNQCMGCNMSLPSAVATKVRESDAMIECENCGSILYAK